MNFSLQSKLSENCHLYLPEVIKHMLNGISWQLMSYVILQAQGSLFPPCFWLPSCTALVTVASSFAINKVQKVTFAYWPRRKASSVFLSAQSSFNYVWPQKCRFIYQKATFQFLNGSGPATSLSNPDCKSICHSPRAVLVASNHP